MELVPDGVVQRFLPHPVEHLFQVEAQIRLQAEVGRDLDTVARPDGGELLFERRHEAFHGQRFRP